MRKREAYTFRVRIDHHGDVVIEDPIFDDAENYSHILLHPDQVDLLIKWLGDARDEALAATKKEA